MDDTNIVVELEEVLVVELGGTIVGVYLGIYVHKTRDRRREQSEKNIPFTGQILMESGHYNDHYKANAYTTIPK